MSKTLRKLVDEWVIFWESQHSRGEQTESMGLFIAKKVRENLLDSYLEDVKEFVKLSPEIRKEILQKYSIDKPVDTNLNEGMDSDI
jgi:hypothetical protein